MTALPMDAELASLCAQIYAGSAGFDHFDAGSDDGVCWGVRSLAGVDIVVFRGSEVFEDWVRDFLATPIDVPIGHVHGGFYLGLGTVLAEARSLLTQPVIVTGHSLGAARASLFAALMVKEGRLPLARVVFGEPKPGYVDLAQLLSAVPGRSYRNGDALHHDLVTDVPFTVPPFDYVHPTPIIPVCAEPSADDRWGMFSYHHIELYEAALAALATGQAAHAAA